MLVGSGVGTGSLSSPSLSAFEFGSHSMRGGWHARDLSSPYVDGAHVSVPGPGTYFAEDPSASLIDHSPPAAPVRVIGGVLQRVESKASAPFDTSGECEC